MKPTKEPDDEQPEACEGCGALASTRDTEGVPLCKECAQLPDDGGGAAAGEQSGAPDNSRGKQFDAAHGSAFLRSIVEGLAVAVAFDALEDCYQQGEAANSQGYAREQNPYPKGDARREWWDGGWCDELDELCGEP